MGNIARRMKAYVVLNSVETREAGLGIGGGTGDTVIQGHSGACRCLENLDVVPAVRICYT